VRWVARLALASVVLATGCVRHAVLENDVRSAEWKARALSTASNLHLAEAALSAQLVELEALYQRDDRDARVRSLLSRGYGLMARGFIEARRLEALAEPDDARAELELRSRKDAEARPRPSVRQKSGSSARYSAVSLAVTCRLASPSAAPSDHGGSACSATIRA
jgi:hypothetical protein